MIYPTRSGVKLYFDMADVPPADIEQPLFVRDLCGRTLAEIPSNGAWTLDSLVAQLNELRVRECVSDAGGADAYLGAFWIGSTEV
ncbi:hypothetical protein [Burkholderia stagnalis]|uniref:hypothetical protein n=1 Tax=Burkholderia stagnalis TaxID=1503054 RepID=UPI000AE2E42E|nr:hypothetical protein [Burkholderia stagnalis]